MQQNAQLNAGMAAVRQQVLNWLYSVLTSEYKDVNRTYNDVAQTLSHYSSLSPRTDVYSTKLSVKPDWICANASSTAYETGSSALLLHLSGTIPVDFRGTTYRFPIALWVPHGYPHEPPLVYVSPTEGMMVRPGQHVDPQGKIYHPYLVGWAEYWDKSNILDFLAILRDIFAKEPPVVARPQQPSRPAEAVASPPPLPPLPPGIGRPQSIVSSSSDSSRPPPPPPKPQLQNSPESFRRDSGPPLPPLPPQTGQDSIRFSSPAHQSHNFHGHAPQRSSSLRYESAPPLPQHPSRQSGGREASPVSPITPPQDANRRGPYNPIYEGQIPYNSHPRGSVAHPPPPGNNTQYMHPQQGPPPQQWQNYGPPQGPQQALQKPPPIPDLLDAPLTLPVPTEASTNLPAPPVPPNPEKDMLLHNIGRALQSQRLHTRTQTTSSLPGLESQHKAMLQALSNMQAEMAALENLDTLLKTNTSILHTALHDADAVIQSSQHRTAPNVDELLVAPTVVGNQLYELVSEERSLGDALFVLSRAVERGRISPAVFAKMTRSLSREWYLKKALAKKIGVGMGLSTY
ncbi:UBC-like protein [Glarea lozoyensis ATCC 20868]|uniref:UBC-like protein n=1 Tax=Glarea lozoyensis (strain ATCC 20868 / MF5171) TaxID=1116229 RepID=S3CWW8_GLAL2|nr:UBC-like protein [Glarea lozoyensis ATCC 20868]EPE29444.1 UBC-like protein [Glarea lozoyensis ATCC 20868]